MDRTRRVLVMPGNTEVGMEIWRSLRHCRNVFLFSASCEVPSHADTVFKHCFFVPNVNQGEWIEPLNRIVESAQIDYIYPAYDDVVLELAISADRLDAEIISSPLDTCEITRSKTKTYNWLAGTLRVPRVYEGEEAVEKFPVFLKPDVGQGSQNAMRIDDELSLKVALKNIPGLIIMENIEGKEYTVDCFSDRDKGLMFASGRVRVRTRNGISMNSYPVDDARFKDCAAAISSRLAFHGAWFFQVKESPGEELVLLEVAPRISGAMATHRVTGVNFPLLSILEHERADFEINAEPFQVEIERALVNRYRHDLNYERVYVDLDDTLFFQDKVNWELVGFLYQCPNEGRRLVAISRSEQDPAEILTRHRLHALFDEVISVKPSEAKTDFMEPEGSIFIDDSFSERMQARSKGFRTLDCSMIELLIDHRV